ncbi:MAG: ATP-binding protein [Nitrospirota bacterium]|jgi:signal transduction histidine kinase
MSNFLRHIADSLTGKLVAVLGALILLGSAVFWYAYVREDKKHLMDNSVAFVASFSEVMKRSLRDDMLLFHREGIQRAVESIGGAESISKVMVLDGGGTIAYSSEKGEIGRRLELTSSACVGCHKDPLRPEKAITDGKQWTVYEDPSGQRVLSYVEPIRNEPDCQTAPCHAHAPDRKVLGVLVTDYSLGPIDAMVAGQVRDTSLYMLAFIALFTAVLYLVLWRFVLRPVTGLSRGMESVSSGDLSQRVPATSHDEIGRLALTFNAMTEEIGTARGRLEDWTRSLEAEVRKKSEEIKSAQGRLVQAEKLAALGRLTADIAHEIRNPLTALGGFGRRLLRMAENEKEKEYAEIVVAEVDRLEHILRDVLTFSREAKLNFERQPLTPAIESSLAAFGDLCREQSIRVETDFATELHALVDRDQIRQAADNLVSNAIDAMPGGGTLSVGTSEVELNGITYVALHVSDTGPGIPEDKLHLIFEPFYTTKKIGHGTGLGLSISRKIMEEHGGFISARNRPEGGLTMSLFFPYQSERDLKGVPCWEFMKCGRDTDSEIKCPAYPHFGRVCWVVAGTFCEGKVQGTFAQKCEDCRKCEFYRKVTAREV